MKKSDFLYRELLYGVLEEKKTVFTQLSLSQTLGISLSTTNLALRPLGKIGAVSIGHQGFRVTDAEKIAAYWSGRRNLAGDVIYKTRADLQVSEIEKSVPGGTIYAAYSAYKLRFNDVPADYSEVYVYAGSPVLDELRLRFPPRKGPPNVFVLASDQHLSRLCLDGISPLGQVYVDLWNLGEWYATDFLRALRERLAW